MLPPTAAQRKSAEQYQELRQVAGLCLFCLLWCCAYAAVLGVLVAVTFMVATVTFTAAGDDTMTNNTWARN